MLDAYTIRKAIPRILIAVIAINLSIYLCVAALDITTIVAKSLNQLLVSPFIEPDSFKGIKIQANTENTIMGILGAGAITTLFGAIIASGGAAGISILGFLLPLIITISILSLAIVFTLVIWQALVIFLTIVSPVAIACYVLPGTEKYFKQWWDLYFKTLIVFPMIAVFFAVSNVMAAILLKGSQASPDSIGVAQLFAVVVVVFAPLVLIPFAFKLSGGLISQVGQIAGGHASGLSKKAGQSVKQNRQDPNSWLGSRAIKARGDRKTAGYTPAQVAGGVVGGIKHRARGGSFRTGYSAKSGAIGGVAAYDDATAFMENNQAFKAFKGNDDALWAFTNGTNENSVRNILRARGVSDPQALADTTALVMQAKNQVGNQAGLIAAERAQAATGTGYEDNGQMLQQIARASGGDMNVAGRMLAEMRGSASQSGRTDLGQSSFAVQARAMSNMINAQSGGPAYSAADADRDVLDSVIDSSNASYAIHGKPRSVQRIADTHVRRLQNITSGIQAGTHSQRDLDQALASTMGIYDVMSSAAPENARVMADSLMNGQITDPTSGDQISVLDFANAPTTIDNTGFVQMRRDFGNRVQQQLVATQGAAQAGAGQPPPPPGAGQPSPPPGASP